MPRYVTKPRISSTESDYCSTYCTRNISPRNGCWRQEEPWIMENTVIRWTIIWPMVVGAQIHEAGTVIQAPKPVCQFMAEDIPPPVLNQLIIRYLVNLLSGLRNLLVQQDDRNLHNHKQKTPRSVGRVATGFIYDNCLFVCFIIKSFLTYSFFLHLLYQPYLGLCQTQCVQSHQRQPMSAVAITACEVQVSAADSQTVPTVATGV